MSFTVPYTTTKDMRVVAAAIDPSKPLFADTETCGFYKRIRLAQLFQKGWDNVILWENPDPLLLATLLRDKHTVWHNAHYDLTTIAEQNSRIPFIPELVDDTLLLSRLALPKAPAFSLDEIMNYVLGFDPYEAQDLDKKTLQKSDWDKAILTKSQKLYAATDVYYMPDVWEAVKNKCDDIVYKLDMSTLRSCLDFQWVGMPIDEERFTERFNENEERMAEIALPINSNSYKQVRAYLGVDPTQSTGDLELAILANEGNELAADVREDRKLKKQNSFINKYLEFGDTLYGKFKPLAISGRLTSDDENMQQIPRKLKGGFGFPGKEHVIIYADYAQLELRTICAIVACKLMEEIFRDGTDLHSYTAAMIFGEAWEHWQRQIAKTANFNLLYGGGIATFIQILIKQANLFIGEGEANKIRRKWRNLWKEIYKWQQNGIDEYNLGKLGSTPLGRPYSPRLMTDHLNIENQGAGAEVAKLALHYMYPEIKASGCLELMNFIHDSFLIKCPNDEALYKPAAEMLAEKMQLAWFEMSKLFKIEDLPMPVDVAVGFNWGDIENDDIPNLYDFSLEPYKMLEEAHND